MAAGITEHMNAMLSPREAQALLQAQAERLPIESILCSDAGGRVCAVDVANPAPIPPHPGAACDGFAVRARDLNHAGPDTPVLVPVAGSTLTGDAPVCGLPHTAWEVFSGGAVPSPFDTVLRADDPGIAVHTDDGMPRWLRSTAAPVAGANIRACGEDFPAGACLVAAGGAVLPAHLMALASAGVERISVRERARVAVLSTGRELVDDWREDLLSCRIRNGNGPYLVAMLRRHGALPHYLRTIADEPAEFMRALAWASQHRYPLIISSGATAASRQDFVADVLATLGAQLLFRGVAMQPGWSVLGARLPHGGFFLGLPGNPASCAACFRLFALPLLRTLNGVPPEQPLSVELAADCTRDPLRMRMLRARLHNERGRLLATPLAAQEAHRMAPLVTANCWLLLAPGPGPAPAGTLVEALTMLDDATGTE